MSLDMYGEKVAEASALIREFAKVDYYHFLQGDPETALEAFIAMLDQAEEKGRQIEREAISFAIDYKGPLEQMPSDMRWHFHQRAIRMAEEKAEAQLDEALAAVEPLQERIAEIEKQLASAEARIVSGPGAFERIAIAQRAALAARQARGEDVAGQIARLDAYFAPAQPSDKLDAITDTDRINYIESWNQKNTERGFAWNTMAFNAKRPVRDQLDELVRHPRASNEAASKNGETK